MHFNEVYVTDKYLPYSNATYLFQTTNDIHNCNDNAMTLYLNYFFHTKEIGSGKAIHSQKTNG